MPTTSTAADTLAAAVRARVLAHADPAYVAGTVAARRPGKPVRGVRIPLLRSAVREGVKAAGGDEPTVRAAADLLWHADGHEEELAACMLLRVTGVPVTVGQVRDWSPLLDNWLSVDELGGCLGEMLSADPAQVRGLGFLADAASPWMRRLYVVAAIRPVREGLNPAAVPQLATVMQGRDEPVRKAAVWLLRDTQRRRPDVAAEFEAIWPTDAAAPLTRRLRSPLLAAAR